jgi:hypothetical protein
MKAIAVPADADLTRAAARGDGQVHAGGPGSLDGPECRPDESSFFVKATALPEAGQDNIVASEAEPHPTHFLAGLKRSLASR